MTKIYYVNGNVIEVKAKLIEDMFEWNALLARTEKENGKIEKIVYPTGYVWVPKN